MKHMGAIYVYHTRFNSLTFVVHFLIGTFNVNRLVIHNRNVTLHTCYYRFSSS